MYHINLYLLMCQVHGSDKVWITNVNGVLYCEVKE